MKKKRPQQKQTPPTKGLNILAVKRSPLPVEPPQEQPAEESMEKPELDAASAPELVAQTLVDNPAHATPSESAETVRPLDETIAANQRQSRTLATIRDTLLPKLLSGEIRVKEAERLVGAVA
jgi:hypothetical protein